MPETNAGQAQTVMVGTSVGFNGSSCTDNRGIASYFWDFGYGNSSSGVAPAHTYSSMGNYTVTLMVKDLAGSSAASSATVTVGVVIPEFPSAVRLIVFVMLTSVSVLAFKAKHKLSKQARRNHRNK